MSQGNEIKLSPFLFTFSMMLMSFPPATMKVGARFYDLIKKFFRIISYFAFGVEMLIEGSLIHQQKYKYI